MKDTLEKRIRALPAEPGVYIFKDISGKVLYVGKAKSLRDRISSYFQESTQVSSKLESMKRVLHDFEIIVCSSEIEALILESNLIKKYKPTFNVMLRDDKSYPYIAVFLTEEFPHVALTRGRRTKGVRFYGPYVSVRSARNTLRLLQKVFPLRHCRGKKPGGKGSPCLYYSLKMCLGPCTGEISREAYYEYVKSFCGFLEGRHREVLEDLWVRMKDAASKKNYEEAARIRNQIQAAEKVLEHAGFSPSSHSDRDVIGMSKDDLQACFSITQVRSGVNFGSIVLFCDISSNESDEYLLGEFLKRYYADSGSIPPLIFIPFNLPECDALQGWLSNSRNGKVELKVPLRGKRAKEISLATKNSYYALESSKAARAADAEKLKVALEDLKHFLGLKKYPLRIECYDVSTFAGTASVGSMIVFQDGLPERKSYRKFRMKFTQGVDDVGMMREILYRRFRQYLSSESQKSTKSGFSVKPDLIILDGGKGQLSACIDVLKVMKIEDIEIAAIAKRLDEIYLLGVKEPILLPRNSEALFLLQRIRDEAHRFAVRYSRSIMEKRTRESWLDNISGLGEKRKKALIRHFGSTGKIIQASREEILSVHGIPKNVALSIYEVAQKVKNEEKPARKSA